MGRYCVLSWLVLGYFHHLHRRMPMSAERITEAHARVTRGDWETLLRGAGKKISGEYTQCPLQGCAHKSDGGRKNARLFRGKTKDKWVLFCHACSAKADYFDVYQYIHGCDFETALSSVFTAVDDSAVALQISDDQFHISAGYDDSEPWVLVCVIDGETASSTWKSFDRGRSFKRVT
jgi:hypothetical protein